MEQVLRVGYDTGDIVKVVRMGSWAQLNIFSKELQYFMTWQSKKEAM